MKTIEKSNKIYFSITEVAQLFEVNESLLRYWEQEFDTISPKKNGKGVRFYTQSDIEDIRRVYYLVKEQKMTLAGARRQLELNRHRTERDTQLLHRLRIARELLLDIRRQME